MTDTPHINHPGKRLERLDSLLKEIDQFTDEQSARTTREIIHLLMDLHGSALAGILELIAPRNPAIIEELARDELISNLLVLYGLHPLDIETRVRQTLANIHCDAEILGVEDGVVRIQTRGEFPPAQTIEQAIVDNVPDVTSVLILTSSSDARAARMALPILAL